MTAREIAAIAELKYRLRPRIVAMFEAGCDASAIAASLNEDVRLVDQIISRWWHETAPHRRGLLYRDQRHPHVGRAS